MKGRTDEIIDLSRYEIIIVFCGCLLFAMKRDVIKCRSKPIARSERINVGAIGHLASGSVNNGVSPGRIRTTGQPIAFVRSLVARVRVSSRQ